MPGAPLARRSSTAPENAGIGPGGRARPPFPLHEAGEVRTGTSGWVYPAWRGLFYPARAAPRTWLSFYAGHFPTVEINATFYRLPAPHVFRGWRAAVPPGFVFAVKASRFLTHMKRLAPGEDSMTRFFSAVRELGPALGPVLYQLPVSFKKDTARLAAFAARLPPDMAHVFEFRDGSWFAPDVKEILETHALAFCIHDSRGLSVPAWITAKTAYWRFHGNPRAPDGSYGPAALRGPARAMTAAAAAGHGVFAYFNNDAFGAAVRDAARLAALVAGERRRNTRTARKTREGC